MDDAPKYAVGTVIRRNRHHFLRQLLYEIAEVTDKDYILINLTDSYPMRSFTISISAIDIYYVAVEYPTASNVDSLVKHYND